ncbi:hypothetical protein [Piscinibacter sakaiensis]
MATERPTTVSTKAVVSGLIAKAPRPTKLVRSSGWISTAEPP